MVEAGDLKGYFLIHKSILTVVQHRMKEGLYILFCAPYADVGTLERTPLQNIYAATHGVIHSSSLNTAISFRSRRLSFC